MRLLDEQEEKIAKALIRNPRVSDNRLGEENDIPVRTVGRKRARMEGEGLLRYFTELDMSETGTGRFPCRHLYIVRFKMGVTVSDVAEGVGAEPKVVTVFTESVCESYIAEIDGYVALTMVVEGTSDADIVQRFQDRIIPSLHSNHGEDCIEDVSTIRLLSRVRLLRNYLPATNMEKGRIRPDWSVDSIFVG